MSRSLQDRKRALLIRRARERQEDALVERFFPGGTSAFRWADVLAGDTLSPTWRLWIRKWSAVRRLSEQLEATPEIIVRFGSMVDVGGVVVSGRVVASGLERWIREDRNLIRLREPSGRWEVTLDVYDIGEPRIALVVAGERCVDFASLGDGTRVWHWDFLPDHLNDATQAIKHAVLADETVDHAGLQELLGEVGLELRRLDRDSTGNAHAITLGVGPQPDAQRSFDDLRRALVEEIPGLRVHKERL